MTYSIVARDSSTGELGVAVQSHYFGTGRVVTWGEAGVGVVATQSIVEVGYGPRGLDLMREDAPAPEALARLVGRDTMAAIRQVAMVDAAGRVGVHTGGSCVAEAGHATAGGVSAQANMMEKPTVWNAMIEAFEGAASASLARRLLAALDAAEAEGGDIRGRQSAALLVVSGNRSETPWNERLVDLRVDDHPEPLDDLRRLVSTHEGVARLTAVFESGVLFTPDPPADGDLVRILESLDEAQTALGDNREPTFWQAVLLAKAGRFDAAREKIGAACATNPRWAAFPSRLVPMGVLPADVDLLAKLKP